MMSSKNMVAIEDGEEGEASLKKNLASRRSRIILLDFIIMFVLSLVRHREPLVGLAC